MIRYYIFGEVNPRDVKFPSSLYLLHFLQNWYAKTPLGKKRIKAASGKEGDEEPPKTGGKGGKKKGKK